MSKQGLQKLNSELKEKLEKSNIDTALLYEPISDEYWSLDNRIAFCNIEPYDIKNDWQEGIWTIDESVFYDGPDRECWIRSKTVGFCAKFAYVYYQLINGENIDEKYVRNILKEEALFDVSKKMAYFNIKPTFSQTVREDISGVNKLFTEDYYSFIKNYINELDPAVLIIGGKNPLNLINIALNPINIQYDSLPVKSFNDCTYMSIKHPSACGVGYKYMFEKANNLVSFIKKQK